MSKHRVDIAADAEDDLREIISHVAESDSVERAEDLLSRLLDVCDSLELNPARGRYVPELKEIGIKSFREILRKPYRIIYEITGRRVHVLVIADGRRKLETLLRNRLVR